MGACECENPIEFGYELNASEKDKDTDNNDKEKKEYFSKLNYKKNNYKYIANQNLNLNYQKFKENNEIINIDKNENEMDNRNNYDIYDIVEPKKISEENKEGVNALKFHIESKNGLRQPSHFAHVSRRFSQQSFGLLFVRHIVSYTEHVPESNPIGSYLHFYIHQQETLHP